MEIISRIHALKDNGIERIRKSSIFQSIRSNFTLTEKDAIALAIIRQLADSLPADLRAMTPEQAEEAIRKRLGSGIDIKDVMEAISSWTENGMVYKHISIPSWIKHILPEDPMPSCLTAKDIPLSETAGYLEMDSHIASVIKHAISSRTPMMLRIETKLDLEDLYILKRALSEYGISAFILDGPECVSAADDSISGALYAYHHNGIMLVPGSFCGFSEIMDNNIGKRLSLRWGGYKPKNNDPDEFDSENSQASEERKNLQKKGILVIDTALSYITGNRLLSEYSKSFGDSEAKAICRLSSEFGARPDTVLTYKPLVSEILRKNDEESLKIVLQSFNDREKPSGSVFLDNTKMAICAAVFGVAYLGMVYLGAAITGLLTPSGWGILGYEPIYGVWFMAASFITYVIRKPGIGIIAEMLAALLEVLMGNMFGPIIFISGFIQGLGCEAAFFFTKYRKYDQTTMILSAVGASVLSFIWTGIRQSYWNMSIGVVLLILVIRTISAIIFCGFGSRFLAEGLAKAGVLKGYAIASDSEASYGK